MTRKQIEKALAKANVEFNAGEVEIEKDEVTVCVGYFVNENGFGNCNKVKTAKLAKQVSSALGWAGSFSTGYGATVLQPGKPVDLGDYNSVASRWHY